MGIEKGSTVELWLNPFSYAWGRHLNSIEDGKNKRAFVKYRDQYGVYHAAVRLERRFVKIIQIKNLIYYDGRNSAIIEGEDENCTFSANLSNTEFIWREDGHVPRSRAYEFCLASQAYNNNILILDDEGNQPKPEAPIIVCPDHNWAYHKNSKCPFCSGDRKNNPETPRCYNTLCSKTISVFVNESNEGIKTVSQVIKI